MINKISSFCIIVGLLLGCSTASAAYYYYQPGYTVVTTSSCSTCNPCNACQSRCTVRHTCSYVKHHYRHASHHKYYYASPPRSHYSISSYYVYTSPFGNAMWVPACGGCCSGGCVSAEEYDRAFYGPYYPADSDFDFDTRTADDVYDEY